MGNEDVLPIHYEDWKWNNGTGRVKWCGEWGCRVKEGIQGEMTNSKDLWKSYLEKATAITIEVSKNYTCMCMYIWFFDGIAL